jgi:hypothetical protein
MKPPLQLLALLMLPAAFAQTTVYVSSDGNATIQGSQSLWLRGGADTIRWQPVSPHLDESSISLSAKTARADGQVRGTTGVNASLNILGERFLHDGSTRDSLLALYRGQDVQVGDITGRLIDSKDGKASILETADGKIVLNPAGPIILPKLDPPPALQPTLLWQLDAAPRGQLDLTLRYRSKEIRWQSSSSLIFAEDLSKASLKASVKLHNKAGIDLMEAQWLVLESADQAFALPGRHSLANGAALRIPTVTLRDLPVTTISTFDPVVQGKANIPKQRLHTRARLTLPADVAPMPAGSAQLRRGLANGLFKEMGSHKLGTLKGDSKIDVKLGDSPHLQGERKQTQFKELPDGKAQEQTITITLHNGGDAALTAEAIEHPWGKWEIVEPSHPFKKAGKNAVFAVEVPAKGKITITYRLRIAY